MTIIEAYNITKKFGDITAVVPVLCLIAIQITGLVWFNTIAALALALGIFIVDFVVLRIAVQLFQRESIVIKWR